ncbi:MAG: hypothetical protein FWD17_07650 [Polyangiaceae bacterium]|nr:hypothetical protein [Polyangiaceae bacterium]
MSRRSARDVPLGALVVLAAVASAAPAAAATVVVLRAPSADDVTGEATARVQGELAAAGFHVVVLPPADPEMRADVETAGRQLAPVGAFAISVRNEGGHRIAEIWVCDRTRGRTIVESARLTEADHGRESEVLAVRAVELLRASLAELWLRPPDPQPSPQAPPDAQTSRVAASPRARDRDAGATRGPSFASGIGLGAGIGLMMSTRDGGPVVFPSLYLVYGQWSGYSLQVGLRGLGPALTVSTAVGTARIEQQIASADVVKTWWPQWPVVPFVCLGVGAEHLHVSGSAAAPYVGTTTDNVALVTSAGVGAAIRIYAGLSFVFQSRGVLAWPPTEVRIAGVDAGRFGGPSLLVDGAVLGVFP